MIKLFEQPFSPEEEIERGQMHQYTLLQTINSMRQAAYEREADPLFFKIQRNEATQEEWLAKIAEIKARYPKP